MTGFRVFAYLLALVMLLLAWVFAYNGLPEHTLQAVLGAILAVFLAVWSRETERYREAQRRAPRRPWAKR